MDKKNINRQYVGQYFLIMFSASVVVCGFAFMQYCAIQKVDFNPTDYLIPIIVGAIFGALIARIRILLKKLNIERELVIEKNMKIHSYVGTIVHDLKSPLSAIHSLMDLFSEESDNLSNDQKVYLTLMKQSSTSMIENIILYIAS